MDTRAAKLALARKKLKDHQDKKLNLFSRRDSFVNPEEPDLNHGSNLELNYTIMNNASSNNQVIHDKSSLHKNIGQMQQNTDAPEYVQSANVTEILISNKCNLELQISELKSQFSTLEENYKLTIDNYKYATQKIQYMESELDNTNSKLLESTKNLIIKDQVIKELNDLKNKLCDENANYLEQLEFMKTVLTAKEAENSSLHSQLYNLQNKFDTTVLQLQQLTNGSVGQLPNSSDDMEQTEVLKQKILDLEQHVKKLQTERDQINSHYEHYINELNNQLRALMNQNEDLTKEVKNLFNRENSLIDQISDMEIRMQMYSTHKANSNSSNCNSDVISMAQYNKLLADFNQVQSNLEELTYKQDLLLKSYTDCIAKLKDLEEVKEFEQEHNKSLSKLNADIASDKVAAQIATEQNKKLKEDVQKLEEAFVKMGKDKLELTEKLTAEKYLTRELTLKLAEVEENAKANENKLKAKDEEMMRLQVNCRSTEEKYQQILKNSEINGNTASLNSNKITKQDSDPLVNANVAIYHASDDIGNNGDNDPHDRTKIDKEDAMNKLQDRFLKIMEDVAALSDEKHRLEHIILQLQTETDTICEYVALYQQQRSLLKRRDEERSAQLKIFQSECERLRNQLEELTNILLRFVEDKDLSMYFLTESKRIDKDKVMSLLSTLKTNSLIDPAQNALDFKAFYPCSCCSGKLIEV